MQLVDILKKAQQRPHNLNKEEIIFLLSLENKEDLDQLYQAAYQIKLKNCGNLVNFRGLIEVSNICQKDCYYCGIRKSNQNIERFCLEHDTIIRLAQWAYDHNYGSIVLQAGEIESDKMTDFIEKILKEITELSNGELGITLSLGEQTPEVYKRWKDAGAHRYLLRIESSNEDFYYQLHPQENHDYQRRLKCLKSLQELNYQVGSGVLIGVPGQTIENLVQDLLFFKEFDLDMIGMGPYLPHPQTPMGCDIVNTSELQAKQLKLGLKMIATTRLFLHDTNIASTTALQALSPDGRELGLLAGGNVIMPNITDTEYRQKYLLYANKPSLNENSTESTNKLTNKIHAIGEKINWGKQGNSVHFARRQK